MKRFLGGGDPLEGFDEDSRRVMAFAREEGELFAQHYVGTEHILAGLLRGGDVVVIGALRTFDIDVASVRMTLQLIIGRGEMPGPPPSGPLTKRAKKVLDLARDEAGHGPVRPGHMLLGLLREGGGVAVAILEELGVDPTALRTTVIHLLGETRDRAP